MWRTFAVTIGAFVFCVSAGLTSGNAGQVSLQVPITAVVAVLTALGLNDPATPPRSSDSARADGTCRVATDQS